MRIIGLTGGIACGKSNISDMLSSLGCVIIDGDKLSRELTVPGGIALPSIREAFGPSVFHEDGSLNRKALAGVVFSDRSALQKLDSIMQPMLLGRIRERIAEERLKHTEFCVLDMPLLFEKKLDLLCDTVWCAWLPGQLQLERLMNRDGLDESQAQQRIRSQMPVDEKAARSAVVISTEGSITETRAKIPPLLEAERKLSSSPTETIAISRKRRSDRYISVVSVENESPALPDEMKFRNDSGVSPSPRRSQRSVPPDVMERPSAVRSPEPLKTKAEWKMPSWLLTSVVTAFFVLLAMITASALMKGYLKQQSDKREAAFQRVVDNHPIVWEEAIRTYSEEFNLQPGFVSAIIMNESSFRPRAESSVGARGLMQLMPDTAEWIAHKLNIEGYSFDRMYDPETNIRFGCWYLHYLSGLFRGDPVCVSAAYHAGQGQVTGWLSDPEKSPDGITLDLNALGDGPTKTYIGRVTQDYGIYNALYFTEDDLSPDTDLSPASVTAD